MFAFGFVKSTSPDAGSPPQEMVVVPTAENPACSRVAAASVGVMPVTLGTWATVPPFVSPLYGLGTVGGGVVEGGGVTTVGGITDSVVVVTGVVVTGVVVGAAARSVDGVVVGADEVVPPHAAIEIPATEKAAMVTRCLPGFLVITEPRRGSC